MEASELGTVIKYIFFLGAYGWFAIMSHDGFVCNEPKQGFGWFVAAFLTAVYYYRGW